MNKNFWKRGIAPIIPLLIIGGLALITVIGSLMTQNKKQTTSSQAYQPEIRILKCPASPVCVNSGSFHCDPGSCPSGYHDYTQVTCENQIDHNKCPQGAMWQCGKSCIQDITPTPKQPTPTQAIPTWSPSTVPTVAPTVIPTAAPTVTPIPTTTTVPGYNCGPNSSPGCGGQPYGYVPCYVASLTGRCTKEATSTNCTCIELGATYTPTPPIPTSTPVPTAIPANFCGSGSDPFCGGSPHTNGSKCSISGVSGHCQKLGTGCVCNPDVTPSSIPTVQPTLFPTVTPGFVCSGASYQDCAYKTLPHSCTYIDGRSGSCVRNGAGGSNCSCLPNGLITPTIVPTRVPTPTPTSAPSCGSQYAYCGLFGKTCCNGLSCSGLICTPKFQPSPTPTARPIGCGSQGTGGKCGSAGGCSPSYRCSSTGGPSSCTYDPSCVYPTITPQPSATPKPECSGLCYGDGDCSRCGEKCIHSECVYVAPTASPTPKPQCPSNCNFAGDCNSCGSNYSCKFHECVYVAPTATPGPTRPYSTPVPSATLTPTPTPKAPSCVADGGSCTQTSSCCGGLQCNSTKGTPGYGTCMQDTNGGCSFSACDSRGTPQSKCTAHYYNPDPQRWPDGDHCGRPDTLQCQGNGVNNCMTPAPIQPTVAPTPIICGPILQNGCSFFQYSNIAHHDANTSVTFGIQYDGKGHMNRYSATGDCSQPSGPSRDSYPGCSTGYNPVNGKDSRYGANGCTGAIQLKSSNTTFCTITAGFDNANSCQFNICLNQPVSPTPTTPPKKQACNVDVGPIASQKVEGSTYTVTVPLKNNQNKKVDVKMSLRAFTCLFNNQATCPHGNGYPANNNQKSEPTYTLNGGETKMLTIQINQPAGVCGQFQTDANIISVNGDANCNTGDPFATSLYKMPTACSVPSTTPILLTKCMPSKGDSNGDGKIDIQDYAQWLNEATGKTNTKKADFNCDGKVDLIDYTIWLTNH